MGLEGRYTVLVKERREEKLWSKYRLAKEAGVSAHTVANVEAGTYPPSPETARGIAEALEGDVDDFDDTAVGRVIDEDVAKAGPLLHILTERQDEVVTGSAGAVIRWADAYQICGEQQASFERLHAQVFLACRNQTFTVTSHVTRAFERTK